MKNLAFVLISLFGSFFVNAQNPINLNQGVIESKNYHQTVKYQKNKNKIIVNVSVHGKNYKFLLDTGAPFSVSKKFFEENHLQKKAAINILDASGKKSEVITTTLPRLQIGEISFLNSEGIVLPDSASVLTDCFKIDGIIGSNMLRNSVLQIDDKRQEITITKNARTLNLQKVPYQPMKLSAFQSNPQITLILQKGTERLADNLLFDSGMDSFYDMSYEAYQFFNKKYVLELIAEGKGSMVWGLHGYEKPKPMALFNIPSVIVNDHRFNNVTVSTTPAHESRLGALLLEYGKVTLDYSKKRFYFEPYSKEENHKNLSQRPMGISPIVLDSKLAVGIIWDKALEGQVNVGDEILHVNGIDFEKLNFCDLFMFYSKTAVEKAVLKLRDVKTKQIKTVTVKRL